MPVAAGPHVVGVSFVRRMWEPEGVLQGHQAGEVLSNDEVYYGNAAVDSGLHRRALRCDRVERHTEPSRGLHLPAERTG